MYLAPQPMKESLNVQDETKRFQQSNKIIPIDMFIIYSFYFYYVGFIQQKNQVKDLLAFTLNLILLKGEIIQVNLQGNLNFFLEACQKLSFSMIKLISQTHKCLASISPLFLNRFHRQSIRFCYQEFDKEAISDGFMADFSVFRGRGWILSDSRELSFCGHCLPCFNSKECLKLKEITFRQL